MPIFYLLLEYLVSVSRIIAQVLWKSAEELVSIFMSDVANHQETKFNL